MPGDLPENQTSRNSFRATALLRSSSLAAKTNVTPVPATSLSIRNAGRSLSLNLGEIRLDEPNTIHRAFEVRLDRIPEFQLHHRSLAGNLGSVVHRDCGWIQFVEEEELRTLSY